MLRLSIFNVLAVQRRPSPTSRSRNLGTPLTVTVMVHSSPPVRIGHAVDAVCLFSGRKTKVIRIGTFSRRQTLERPNSDPCAPLLASRASINDETIHEIAAPPGANVCLTVTLATPNL